MTNLPRSLKSLNSTGWKIHLPALGGVRSTARSMTTGARARVSMPRWVCSAAMDVT